MMKQKRFKYLSASERDEIEILHNKGYSARSIAKALGRSPNTVSYELKRTPKTAYRAKLGGQYARTKVMYRRLEFSKIESTPKLKRYVIESLAKGWNPDEIGGRMKREKKPWYASKSAIYKWLETIRGERYKKYLYAYRPGRRQKKPKGLYVQIKHMTPIETRMLSATNRSRYGHWESDLVVSKRGTRGGLSVHLERKSRYYRVEKVSGLSSAEKQKTLEHLAKEFSVQSITFDRGRENARHYELDIPTFFCNPYHSWEKGSVENANKCLRRFLPKKTDLSIVPEEEIQRIVSMINNKPRKILDYQTATEVALAGGVINRVS